MCLIFILHALTALAFAVQQAGVYALFPMSVTRAHRPGFMVVPHTPPLIQFLLPAAVLGQAQLLLFSQAQSCVCQEGCVGEGCSWLFETDLEVESLLKALPGGLEVECLQYD